MSLANLKQAFSKIRSRISDFIGNKPHKWKNNFRDYYNSIRPYTNYLLREVVPNFGAHGLLLNLPATFFLGYELNLFSVYAFGSLWYVTFVLLPDAINDSIPYIKVVSNQ